MTGLFTPLKRYFYATFFTLAISILTYIVNSVNNIGISLFLSVVALAFGVMQMYAVYCMRPLSERFVKAFRYLLISVLGMLITLILTIVTAFSNITVALILLVISLLFGCFSIVASYHLFWGFDDMVVQRNYDYPVGRIKWCFWLSIINGIVSGTLKNLGLNIFAVVVNVSISIASLWILYTFLQAVEKAEYSI